MFKKFSPEELQCCCLWDYYALSNTGAPRGVQELTEIYRENLLQRKWNASINLWDNFALVS